MSTVEEFERLIQQVENAGYKIRYDYFGGTGGGICQVGRTNWLFVDLALSVTERLDQIQTQMESDPVFSASLEPINRAA